jgi:phasin family protein
MINQPKANARSRDASPTKAAAREPLEKVIPAPAKPAVRVTDTISETTQKPKASAQVQETSPTKAAARAPLEKVIPAPAKPVVSVADAISETTQKPKATAQVQEILPPKVAAREPLEKVIPPASEPVVTIITDAISETITMIADSGSVSGEVVKPNAPINTINPNPMLGTKTMIKSTEDFVAFGQANVEAFVKSGQIWAAGVQELMKQFATATKVSFDESASAFKAISSAKSITEAMDLQSKFASSTVAKTLAESNKFIDASIKLTEQTLAPISARVTGAVETFGKAA